MSNRTVRRPLVLVLAWVLSLVGAGVAGAALTQRDHEPKVISGSDFGFMVERIGRNDAPIGRLVVRVNGKWVDPEIAPAMRLAK
ncbi:MAG: hypothetical protein M3541_00550 [Acidobacteriota bacterium]|jgi:hypothetical protein|nr:hypothetical protein [Acidobacteriota bacterium]MDQ3417273.1 hypothetical protein [Acidobacteriota bacterium]